MRSAVSVSCAAFMGSVAVALQFMDERQCAALVAGGVVHDGLNAAIQHLTAIGIPDVLYRPKGDGKKISKPVVCETVADFVEHYSEVSAIGLELQRLITARIETNIKRGLWQNDKVRARVQSAGDKNAVKWLVHRAATHTHECSNQ